MSHNHTHSCHDEHNHNHDHTDDLTPATHTTLYQHIDHPHIYTLNETAPNSGRAIVEKPWDSRLAPTPVLTSPTDDPQLLMHIPFTGQVKLHSILLRAPPTGSAPRKLKLFKNRLDLDFGMASELQPTQTIELPRGVEGASDGDGVLEVGVKRALWTAVMSVTLFFVNNWGSPNDGSDGGHDDDEEEEEEDEDEGGEGEEEVQTEISYLGFRGDWLRAGGAPIGVLYESAANPADHKLVHKTDWKGGARMGSEGGHGPL